MSRYSASLVCFLILFIGCGAPKDPNEARAAFEQLQADVEKKNLDRVWERITRRSQETLGRALMEAQKTDQQITAKQQQAEALRLLHAKIAQVKIAKIQTGSDRATLTIEKPGAGQGGGTETVALLWEDKMWKIVLYPD